MPHKEFTRNRMHLKSIKGLKEKLNTLSGKVEQLAANGGGLLATAGFGTVGRVADATADELRELDGVGPKTVRDIVGHLLAFAEQDIAGKRSFGLRAVDRCQMQKMHPLIFISQRAPPAFINHRAI